MALLEIRDLRIEFPTRRGTLVAVDGISLTIDEGEVLGVTRESGTGRLHDPPAVPVRRGALPARRDRRHPGGANALRFTPHFGIRSAEIDLIVVGTRGHSKSSAASMGSVSRKLLDLTEINCLVVR